MSEIFNVSYIDPFDISDPHTQLVNITNGVLHYVMFKIRGILAVMQTSTILVVMFKMKDL